MSAPAPERDSADWLRRDAENISSALPPLLAEAELLAASVAPGVHGRKRAGPGESFWQYRPAMPGDPLSAIDWRRSARSDHLFVREMEWEAAQTVWIWADQGQSMRFRSDDAPRAKEERARLLALALTVLLIAGGERVGVLGGDAADPATGERQLVRAARALAQAPVDPPDFSTPPQAAWRRGGMAVFLSDFLGPLDGLRAAVGAAADAGVRGVLLRVLDPAERDFPYGGRIIFESMGRQTRFETQRADALAGEYRARFAERAAELETIARAAGWRLLSHDTGVSPRKGLLALYGAVGGRS